MKLLRIARVPPLVVAPEDSVMTAVEKMCDAGVGAVIVVKNSDLIGIFTERDLLTGVVRPGLSTRNTPIAKVMTKNPNVALAEMEASEAFEFMTEKNIRIKTFNGFAISACVKLFNRIVAISLPKSVGRFSIRWVFAFC